MPPRKRKSSKKTPTTPLPPPSGTDPESEIKPEPKTLAEYILETMNLQEIADALGELEDTQFMELVDILVRQKEDILKQRSPFTMPTIKEIKGSEAHKRNMKDPIKIYGSSEDYYIDPNWALIPESNVIQAVIRARAKPSLKEVEIFNFYYTKKRETGEIQNVQPEFVG